MDQINMNKLGSDPSNRMSQKPGGQRTNGQSSGEKRGIVEDLGSDFGPQKRVVKGKTKTLETTPVGLRSNGTIEFSDSDDELPQIAPGKSKGKQIESAKVATGNMDVATILVKENKLKGMPRIPKKNGGSSSQSKPGNSAEASGSTSQLKPSAAVRGKSPRPRQVSPEPQTSRTRYTRDATRDAVVASISAVPPIKPRAVAKRAEPSSFPMGDAPPRASRSPRPPPTHVAQPAPFPSLGASPLESRAIIPVQIVPSPFPDLSPLKNEASSSSSSKPPMKRLAPVIARSSSKASASSAGKSKKPSKMRVVSSDEEGDGEEDFVVVTKAQAFPMNTQMLAGLREASQISPGESSKRPQLYDDYRDKKKPRISAGSRVLEELAEEGYSVFWHAGIDADSLCPYCDEPLPENPSPHLLKLLKDTEARSYKDKRPSNPKGRKAPVPVFIVVCQRHQFELKLLPKAKAKGWPEAIHFEGLSVRVLGMQKMLQDIIRDPGQGDVPSEDDDGTIVSSNLGSLSALSARSDSVFWREIKREIKKKGARAVAGVAGQFANFEKTQPGYYGELGSVIIHQTLYSMFPLNDFDSNLTIPLTPNEFVQRILVPEVATALIMEDMGLDKPDAVRTLRDSAPYGVAMFPDTHGVGGGNAAGDRIVKDRAKKRRKELEAEETAGDLLYDEKQRKKQDKEDRKGKGRAVSVSMGDTDVSDAPPAPPKSRKGREASINNMGMVVEVNSIPPPKARPPPKKKYIIEGDDSGISDAGSSSRPKPRPKPKPLAKKPSVTIPPEPPNHRRTSKRKSKDSSDAERFSAHQRKRSKVQSSEDDDSDEPVLPPPEILERARSRASSMVFSDDAQVSGHPVDIDLTDGDSDEEPPLPPSPLRTKHKTTGTTFKPAAKARPAPFPMPGASQDSDTIEFVEVPPQSAAPSSPVASRMTRSRSRSVIRDSSDDEVGDRTVRMDATPRPKKGKAKAKKVGKTKVNPSRSPSVSFVEVPATAAPKKLKKRVKDVVDDGDSDDAVVGVYERSWLKDSDDSSSEPRGMSPTEVLNKDHKEWLLSSSQ